MCKKFLLSLLAVFAASTLMFSLHSFTLTANAYNASTTGYAEKTVDGDAVFNGMDTTIPASKYVSNNVSGQYLMLNGSGQTLGWSIPITKMRDLVVEFDYMDDGDAASGYYQFGPWSQNFNLQWPYFNAGLEEGCGILNPTHIGAPADGLRLHDLTKTGELVVCDRYGYPFNNNYRVRLTFKIDTGDLYIAQRPVNSNEPFVDEIRVETFCTPPTDISESKPYYF